MVTPIVSIKYRYLYQLCYVKLFSTNQSGNLVLLDDPGRVTCMYRSQITSAQADVALLGQHLSPEVTPARRSRFTTLAGAAQGETGRGFRGFT